MGRPYLDELEEIPRTIDWACAAVLPVEGRVWIDDKLPRVFIGSGGSYTVALALAQHYGRLFRRASWAMSPLQYGQRSPELPAHTTSLVSAEGKNRDILFAVAASEKFAKQTQILTFSAKSPLLNVAADRINIDVIAMQSPWARDGYLATNSLLASVILGFKMQGGHLLMAKELIEIFSKFRSNTEIERFAKVIAQSTKVLALHGLNGEVGAIDLESKMAESGFAFVQITDFRQFAHGRHIQLLDMQRPIPVIAFISPHERSLWDEMRSQLPSQIEVLEVALSVDPQVAALTGLLFDLVLTEKVAMALGRDPGQPEVPDFARTLHTIDAATHITFDKSRTNPKMALLTDLVGRGRAIGAAKQFLQKLETAPFRAVVLDFDGTLCETDRRYDGLDVELAPVLTSLLKAGVVVAIATGRGNSVHTDLRKNLPQELWHSCVLGCYSGSLILGLSDSWPTDVEAAPEFSEIQLKLGTLGIQTENGYTLAPRFGQLTIRGGPKGFVESNYASCTDLLGIANGWRVCRSAHSIDILAPSAGKLKVIDFLQQRLGLTSSAEILRVGDRGETAGNDFELLADGFGLSVDGVSESLTSCWYFGDTRLTPVQRTAHYLQSLVATNGTVSFEKSALELWAALL